MEADPRLKQAMDAMDWFNLNRDWLVCASRSYFSHDKSLETFDKLKELDAAREHLRQMYLGQPPLREP